MRFRHLAGFGKRMEYYLIGLMLKEGLDCYVPLVDDDGIDVIIRKSNCSFIEVQIKARSKGVKFGDAALFSAMTHEYRDNYYFVFYSERMDTMWIMSSEEYLNECATNKTGKNVGKRSIWLNGRRKNQETGESEEYPLDRLSKYIAHDFSRFR
ncbi:restriction endonuclease [Bacillus paranthracis]|uniref:restriction endonuclease n=1 Tax=Bacillus paranthracis TaxID=2026186 RepID=UPI0021CED16A|nr:restriction endonuclease [Bacillus paranthracis]MCU5469860.1 restriction endonuclease [Bacillus paranthracis]